MTKRRRQPVQQAIQAAIPKWVKLLDLERWDISVIFGPDTEEESEASCDAQPEYERMTLRFDPDKVPLDMVDRYVAHELLHGPVWALMQCAYTMAKTPRDNEWVRRESEALVTRLEKIVCKLAQP